MSEGFSPTRWAIEISKLLNAVMGPDHFPIKVANVAKEYSVQRFPQDPIAVVRGDSLPGFDGALYPAPAGKKGWGIIYNSAIRSKGRINFTLAHEFGHYLVHRLTHPEGIECGEKDVVRWDSAYGQIEHQANVFAANLLMPLDDYRRLIPANARIDMDMIAAATDRYEVSLTAAILRWLDYTERRAVLVVSRDGFIDWARSSPAALRTGAFFRTAQNTIPVPARSLAAHPSTGGENMVAEFEPGIWFNEPVKEFAVSSEEYGFVVSLLLLEAAPRFSIEEGQPLEDTVQRFER